MGFAASPHLTFTEVEKMCIMGKGGMVMFWRRGKNRAAVFVDYEYWYVSMKELYRAGLEGME